jgi:hypothetical protein
MPEICGGYTTFSAFSLQSLSLFQSGAWLRGGSYVAATVLLCLIAVCTGYLLAKTVAELFPQARRKARLRTYRTPSTRTARAAAEARFSTPSFA